MRYELGRSHQISMNIPFLSTIFVYQSTVGELIVAQKVKQKPKLRRSDLILES
jgi:hypothetical protein